MGDVPALAPDQLSYLQKLVDTLEAPEPFTDTELLLENVFQELGTCYLSALCTKDSSLLLETLLVHADPSWTCRFTFDLVGHSWPDMLQNPYASRVFDACLKSIARATIDPGKIVEFVQLFTRSGRLISLLVGSQFASQSLKHLILMLNNFPDLRKTKIRFRHSLLQHIDIVDVSMTMHGSSLLQFLLLDSYHFDDENHEVPCGQNDPDTWTITNSESWDSHGGSTEFQLIETGLTADESKFGTLVRNQASSHLFEVLLRVAPKNTFQRLLDNRFRGKLMDFIRHPVANFVIQRLIASTRTKPQFETIYEEIKSNFSELFRGRSGVVLQLAHASIRFESFQPAVLDDIVRALNPDAPDSLKRDKFCFTILSISNQPKHVFKKKKERRSDAIFSALGCQLLVELFKFDPAHAQWIYSDFMELELDVLINMGLDRQASRTFESFFLSPHVPLSSKNTFAQKFADHSDSIRALALDKSGSHVLDQLFVNAAVEYKTKIADVIVSIEKELLAVPHGKFVLKNYRIQEYKRNRSDWTRREESKLVRKKAFEDILSFKPKTKNSQQPQQSGTSDRKERKEEKGKSQKMDVDEKSYSKHAKRESNDKDATTHKDKKKEKKEKSKERDGEKKGIKPSDGATTSSNGLQEKSSKKRKREEPTDDIDAIFSVIDDTEPVAKKPKKEEPKVAPAASSSSPSQSHAPVKSEKSNSSESFSASAPPQAPLSKMKLKKLAKAEKRAKREQAASH